MEDKQQLADSLEATDGLRECACVRVSERKREQVNISYHLANIAKTLMYMHTDIGEFAEIKESICYGCSADHQSDAILLRKTKRVDGNSKRADYRVQDNDSSFFFTAKLGSQSPRLL